MKKTVALVYGGDSSEAEVSARSGRHLAREIDRERYQVYEIMIKGRDWKVLLEDGTSPQIDKADFSFIYPSQPRSRRVTFDIALIMIHGTPGENGRLQAYFEMIGIPFTTCSAVVSAITFDKYATKCYLRDTGIKLAPDILVRRGDRYNPSEIVAKLGLPLFIKPNEGGSSFGTTKVKSVEEVAPALELAFKEGDAVIAEEFIPGRELTNGVYENNGELVRLPVTEIIPKNEFFDYEAKYLGASSEVCPAEISKETAKNVIDVTHRLYRYLGCRGVVRMDYILKGEELYFLEINTVPGMTEVSLVPQQIRATGKSISSFLTELLG
ncbi:MAG: D-alanine--D-alanine ligase [Bacteroidales bacterium]|nr:D-alanine--D-alanine ligase [Bacteroidales bacterium]MDD2425125.1 D-alanine--D-alanine ligase [Bacteroidales bacterium]MDD3989454.1 D-alanine--D-alanine ligase [Bacteroidales bacterium]MDD4638274.1 D-alanine--D-alanine ligase [Bacteroidales bacterium]